MAHGINHISLGEQLQSAQWVHYDADHELVFAWYGGQGINVYRNDGTEVAYWTMGGPGKPDMYDAQRSIEEHIEEEYYPY